MSKLMNAMKGIIAVLLLAGLAAGLALMFGTAGQPASAPTATSAARVVTFHSPVQTPTSTPEMWLDLGGPSPTPSRGWNWPPTATAWARITPTPISTPMPTPTLPMIPTPATPVVAALLPQAPVHFSPLDLERLEIEVEETPVASYLTFTWSPDGRKALVSKSGYAHQLVRARREDADPEEGKWMGVYDLWMLDLESGREELVTEAATNWSWSPDGSAVAYVTPVGDRGVEGALYVTGLADGEPRRIARVDLVLSYEQATWLPTDEIIYIFGARLWGVHPDGTGTRQLNDLHLGGANDTEEYSAYRGDTVEFKVSPDGQRIAYTRVVPEAWDPLDPTPGYKYQVWVSDINGENPVLIDENAIQALATWSPNGETIAYHQEAIRAGPGVVARNLVLANLQTGERHTVYEPAGGFDGANHLAWSPWGDVVAFRESMPRSEKWIHVLWFSNLDGSVQKSFWEPAIISRPSMKMTWARDGRYLLVHVRHPGDTATLHRVKLSTSR